VLASKKNCQYTPRSPPASSPDSVSARSASPVSPSGVTPSAADEEANSDTGSASSSSKRARVLSEEELTAQHAIRESQFPHMGLPDDDADFEAMLGDEQADGFYADGFYADDN
jgi:hypothetical protein